MSGDTKMIRPDYSQLANLPAALCTWYESGHRELPWRRDPSAYHVWLSEIMLQQTRVEAVKPYYERFVEELPDVEALARCSDDRLMKLWEGLGYYSRARNLKKAAAVVEEQYAGELPADYERLLELPGIGPYTAGAVASIAFHIPEPAVDGNVVRVITRYTADRRDIRSPRVAADIREALKQVIPADDPGTFNQALMELGALVCVPSGAARCTQCPVRERCRAREEGTAAEIPFKSPPQKRKKEKKTVLILRDGRHTLLHRRPENGLLAGLYEFPCMEGHRTGKEVLEYVEKELHLTAVQIHPLPDAKHIFSHIEWEMKGYMILTEALHNAECYLAVEPERTKDEYPIPAAYRAYAEALQIHIGMQKASEG